MHARSHARTCTHTHRGAAAACRSGHLTCGHEERNAELPAQHPRPQVLQRAPVKRQGSADQHIEHHTQALRKRRPQAQAGQTHWVQPPSEANFSLCIAKPREKSFPTIFFHEPLSRGAQAKMAGGRESTIGLLNKSVQSQKEAFSYQLVRTCSGSWGCEGMGTFSLEFRRRRGGKRALSRYQKGCLSHGRRSGLVFCNSRIWHPKLWGQRRL